MQAVSQWFTLEDRETVRQTVRVLRELKIKEFRTLFSWADWERPGGPEWFDWFVGELEEVEGLRLIPDLFYTPAHRARKDKNGGTKTSYPPEDLASYAQFVGEMISRYGNYFDWLQLWNEPNWRPYWDWDMDPDGVLLVEMLSGAAEVAHAQGKRVALGGVTPLDYPWLARMSEKGLIKLMDAVTFHFSPSWPNQHRRWMPLSTEIHALRAMLVGLGERAEVWLGETGYSTIASSPEERREQEERQIDFFEKVRNLPTEKTIWFCIIDQHPEAPTDDFLNAGTPTDQTAYHFGLITADGQEKPLFRHWKKQAEKSSR